MKPIKKKVLRLFAAGRIGPALLVAGAVALAACSSAAPSSSPTPEEASAVVAETLSATLIPSLSPDATGTVVMATLPPPAVATNTMEPSPISSSSPEPETNLEDGIVALLRAGFQPRLYARYPSPDGSMEAQVLTYDCTTIIEDQQNALDVLQVVDTDSQAVIQEVDNQLQYCGGLGGFGFEGLFWSPSGQYFYYTDAREGSPDGCGHWTRPFSRFNVTDWTTQDLGGGPQSQDGTRLATWNGGDLVVWAIDGGEVGRVAAAAPDQSLGPIVWSPDDQSLAYLQADQFCVPNSSTVVVVDVAGMSSEVVLTSDTPAFQDVAWYGPEQLVLADGAGGRKFLNLATGELTDTP